MYPESSGNPLSRRAFFWATMKKYRCIFRHSNGQTTLQVEADNAESALESAQLTVTEAAQAVEVWDETGLVLQGRDARPGIKI